MGRGVVEELENGILIAGGFFGRLCHQASIAATARTREQALPGSVLLRIGARRRELVDRTDVVASLDLIGQPAPGLGHPEKENSALRIGIMPGHLEAIGGIKPVAGHVFSAHGHPPLRPLT
jgi:hypothetical protein